MFFGRYDYAIDAKGRLNFPAKFREAMGGGTFVVMRWVDECLFAMPMSAIERLAERLGSEEWMKSWQMSGDLFSDTIEVTPDKQGRIILTPELCQYAHLSQNVTIIGNLDHAEIWNTDTWNKRHAAVSNEERIRRLTEMHV